MHLSSAYNFGKAADEWFSPRQPKPMPIVWKCRHPEYTMRRADLEHLMKYNNGLEVMATRAKSFWTKSFSHP